jgi:hypothetical protein
MSEGSSIPSPVKVLFIGGYGRSGSTLLERMLGQIPGVVPAGELRFIWDRGLRDSQLCGCRRPFMECPFWIEVGRAAFGGWDRVDAGEVVALERAVARHRFVPFMVAPGLWPPYRARLRRYRGLLARVYRAIHLTTGSRLIVDSTVDPSHTFLLRHMAGIDLRVAHLIRDSRGVAYSWTTRVIRPEITDRVVPMPSRRPAGTAIRWTVYNSLFHLLPPLGVPVLRLRYEDLVTAPREHLSRVMRHVDEPIEPDDLAFVGNGEVHLEPSHTVAGNPMRFQLGRVPLRVDERWVRELPGRDRRLVSSLTLPLLRWYGYQANPSARG